MGSSYSCFGPLGASRKNVFVWKIDGFTSLLKQGEGTTNTAFDMEGIRWQLSINPMDGENGYSSSEKHVSLTISASPFSLRPNRMLQAKFRIFIYDQIYGKHTVREVSHTYLTTSRKSGVSCMIQLQTLKNPYLGFLINDTIAVGVELIQLRKVACNGIERNSFIQNNKISGSHSWYIDNFFRLKKPIALSEPFDIGGYTWRLKLEQGVITKNYLSIYLKLDKSSSQLPPSGGVMVDLVLSVKKQPTGTCKGRARFNFSSSTTGWGYLQFIRVEEFMNPSNGYLIKGRCTFEASVTILGSSSDRA